MPTFKNKICFRCNPKKLVFTDINLAKHICNHLLGDEHTSGHRMCVGALIMFAGVMLSKVGENLYALHIAMDMSGYFIHAVGSIPFIEKITNLIKTQ